MFAVSGTKNYLWVEAEMAKKLVKKEIDYGYFEKLVADAKKQIEKFGSYEELVS